MNLRGLIDQVIDVAKVAGEVLPPIGGGAAVVEKILEVIDGLKGVAPNTDATDDLEAAHKALYDRVNAKGHAVSDRLNG